MGDRTEVRGFLTASRARLAPAQAGIAVAGSRQVPGLRREEVAAQAGLSLSYYRRLERGGLRGASDSVLEALAAALRLDRAERAYLFALARPPAGRAAAANGARPPRPGVTALLHAITGAAAFASDHRLDVVEANAPARALFSPLFDDPSPNRARFAYLDPRARAFYADWETVACETTAELRAATVSDPHDHRLWELIAQLSARSSAFARHWSAHDVRRRQAGLQVLRHPQRGHVAALPAPHPQRR